MLTPDWVTDLAAGLDRVWFSQEQGQNAAGWISIDGGSVACVRTHFATLAPMPTAFWFGTDLGTINNLQVQEFATHGAQPYPPILGAVLTNRYVGNVTRAASSPSTRPTACRTA